MSSPFDTHGSATQFATPDFLFQIANASTEGILAFDQNLRVTFWNRRLENWTGIAADSAVGRSVRDLFKHDLANGELRHYEESLLGRASDGQLQPLGLGEGSRLCCKRYTPLYDNSGAVIGGCALIHDATAHLEAEAQARESEGRFRVMADYAPVLLWMSGADARCNFFNQKWLEFTGRSQEQEQGYGWAEGIHPEDFQSCIDTYFEAFNARRQFVMEYRLRRADGHYRWVLDTGLPRYLSDGTFSGYIGSCVDITERKSTEEELERALTRERHLRNEAQRLQRHAEDTNRLKDEFLATVSHELRTPLNAIAGWAELLADDMITPEEQREAFVAIDRNARAQTRLINDLLDVSRIITGQMKLDVQPVELANITHEALDTVKFSAESKRQTLKVHIDQTLGPVEGDPTRLQQIIWNLLANAVKFTPSGGHISVTLTRVGSRAEIEVRDNGEGISADFLPYCFDRFRQADSTLTRRHGGLGIGLSVARHLTELHGGTVEAHSDGIGKGATFKVSLPLMAVRLGVSERDQVLAAANREAELASRRSTLAGLTVLVVDDQPDVLRLVAVLLHSHGAEVISVASAKDAFRVLAKTHVDFLLSDIGMPDEDGYTLIERLRKNETTAFTRLPAAALTAHSRDEDRIRALSSGFHEHLTKPVEPEILVNTIARLVGRSAQDYKG